MIEVLKPGMQTTIQDLGRFGQMHYGLAHSGVMDEMSAKIANRLVGVPDNHPVLECTQIGPTLKFHAAVRVAMYGAVAEVRLNDTRMPNQYVFDVSVGDSLAIGPMSHGFRSYIAFADRLDIPKVLNSVSTQLLAGIGGYHGRALEKGDLLTLRAFNNKTTSYNAPALYYTGQYLLRFTESPEYQHFTASQIKQLQQIKFEVSTQLNRMGIRLNTHTPLMFDSYPAMKSRGLSAGAIQVPPDGMPIIAGKDAQTTGGYLRSGQIIQADLPILGQLKPGDSLQLQQISIVEARRIDRKQNALL